MRNLLIGAGVFLSFIQTSLALSHFTLSPEEVGTYVQQCKPDLSKSNIEREIKSHLAKLSVPVITTQKPQLKPNIKTIIDNVKSGKAGAIPKFIEPRLTENVDLDGLALRGISASELDIVDVLTKHVDAQKSYYKDDYPVKKTVSGTTTYIQRLCQTYTCKDRNQTQPFSLASVRSPTVCGDALCAMKQIYGEDKGPLILYAFLKYKLSLTSKTDINADPEGFDVETLTAILTAAAAIPEHLQPKVFEQRHFYRFYKGKTLKMYGADNRVVANAGGAVFDIIDDYDFNEKVYVFIHEMGHRASSQKEGGDLDASAEWLRAASSGSEISKYSLISPAENFAETFTLYRLHPEKLISASTHRYAFMKIMIFKDIEYRDNLCVGRTNSLR